MNSIKFFYFSLFALVFGFIQICDGADTKPIVLVSIAPYKFFVDQIAKDTVEVKMMVPTGGSPHSYEPSVRQILEASRALIWFTIGESFEERALQALKSAHREMRIIDMRSGLSLIGSEEHAGCSHAHSYDPHIWLSPRLVKRQADSIKEALTEKFPEHKALYHKNLQLFHHKLDQLDFEITSKLRGIKNRTLLVSHPAFAYYCKDYGLKQISIEFEGKEPSPQHLTHILDSARKTKSPFVYIQSQQPSKGAKLIANEIGAKIVQVDPLAENYFENMQQMTESFSKQ